MNFNDHYNLKGCHAFLGASNHSWLNYTPERLQEVYISMQAKQEGTELHAIAEQLISHKIKLPNTKKTLNQYVNDAIGFGMTPEVILYYSTYCFGTTDAIRFKNNQLRIHDLKTGVTPASMDQLYIYTALFCLEYGVDPFSLTEIILRIYQLDEVNEVVADPKDIKDVMNLIIEDDKILQEMKVEAL